MAGNKKMAMGRVKREIEEVEKDMEVRCSPARTRTKGQLSTTIQRTLRLQLHFDAGRQPWVPPLPRMLVREQRRPHSAVWWQPGRSLGRRGVKSMNECLPPVLQPYCIQTQHLTQPISRPIVSL